jgi:hypothetical protein
VKLVFVFMIELLSMLHLFKSKRTKYQYRTQWLTYLLQRDFVCVQKDFKKYMWSSSRGTIKLESLKDHVWSLHWSPELIHFYILGFSMTELIARSSFYRLARSRIKETVSPEQTNLKWYESKALSSDICRLFTTMKNFFFFFRGPLNLLCLGHYTIQILNFISNLIWDAPVT